MAHSLGLSARKIASLEECIVHVASRWHNPAQIQNHTLVSCGVECENSLDGFGSGASTVSPRTCWRGVEFYGGSANLRHAGWRIPHWRVRAPPASAPTPVGGSCGTFGWPPRYFLWLRGSCSLQLHLNFGLQAAVQGL